MTPAERADAMERILRPALAVLADTASDPEAVARARGTLREVTRLLDGIHGLPGDRSAPVPPPHDARAHTRRAAEAEAGRLGENSDRQGDGFHGLRKGRDQCTARRRDGEQCQAPAIKGGLVCRRHGGAAPQVAINARYLELQMALYSAAMGYGEAKGTPREIDALGAWSRARNALDEAEAKLGRIAELQAELRRRNAAQPPGTS